MYDFEELKPKNDIEWLALRVQVLTATEVGVILGLNKWQSVSDIVKAKQNPVPFENSYTWLGQALEPVVVLAVNKVLNLPFKLFENGSRSFFMSKQLGLGATPDAGYNGYLLECKSTKPANHLRWSEWPPSYYLCQLYVQLICVQRTTGFLGIMSTDLTQKTEILNLPLHIFRLERNDRLDAIIYSEVLRFNNCRKLGKQYRVNRKQAANVELLLRFSTRKIPHGPNTKIN